MVAKLEMQRYGIKCPLCGEMTLMELDPEKVERWQKGEMCQAVFPELNIYERDVLITHICVACQKKHRI